MKPIFLMIILILLLVSCTPSENNQKSNATTESVTTMEAYPTASAELISKREAIDSLFNYVYNDKDKSTMANIQFSDTESFYGYKYQFIINGEFSNPWHLEFYGMSKDNQYYLFWLNEQVYYDGVFDHAVTGDFYAVSMSTKEIISERNASENSNDWNDDFPEVSRTESPTPTETNTPTPSPEIPVVGVTSSPQPPIERGEEAQYFFVNEGNSKDIGNARFNYWLTIPVEWKAFDRSENGDGYFIECGNENIDMRVYGSYAVFEQEYYLSTDDGSKVSEFLFNSGIKGWKKQKNNDYIKFFYCVGDRYITYYLDYHDDIAWFVKNEDNIISVAKNLRDGEDNTPQDAQEQIPKNEALKYQLDDKNADKYSDVEALVISQLGAVKDESEDCYNTKEYGSIYINCYGQYHNGDYEVRIGPSYYPLSVYDYLRVNLETGKIYSEDGTLLYFSTN